jgi:hypothetical protein
MSTLALASMAFVCLYPFQWFRQLLVHSTLRWPTGILLVTLSALSTYIFEHEYKKRQEASNKKARAKQFEDRFAGLNAKQLQVLSECLNDHPHEQVYPLSDTDIADLVWRDLIFCGDISDGHGYYRLENRAQRHLLAHPEILARR